MNNEERLAMLKKIQQYNFAAYDMLLYLDTHSDDKKAFEMYKELMAKYKMLLNEYQHIYGPLTIEGAATQDVFNWYESPWPWEKCDNKQ